MRTLLRTLTLVLPLALAGCFNPFDPRELGSGISSPPPVPDSPANVLRLLEWAYNHRAISEYREIFTDDYRFAFSALDPQGNAYRDKPWTREDELASATHLFQGGHATEPPASSISLTLDRNFFIQNDLRPNKNNRMHKRIRTNVTLTIVTSTDQTQVTGAAIFYVTRGDSAAIPQELIDRGFRPDSTRWYIERWEDDTVTNTGGGSVAAAIKAPRAATAAPALAERRLSWGGLKNLYR
jgi:hypothetical protein